MFLAESYESAIPHFKYVVESEGQNSAEALLYLAKCYDKTSQPERSLAASEDYLSSQGENKEKEILIRFLNIKNLIKTKNLNLAIIEKNKVRKTISALPKENLISSFNDVKWVYSFVCDRYCIEEIDFFKESQDILLFYVDQKQTFQQSSELILKTYLFYYNTLYSDYFDKNFKNHIARKLLESLTAIKKYELVENNFNSSRHLLNELEKIELDIMNWTSHD